MLKLRAATLLAAIATTSLLAACSSGSGTASSTTTSAGAGASATSAGTSGSAAPSAAASAGASIATGTPTKVVVSFYPLQWAVERVGGPAVSVSNLTKPGAEPHDLELTPQEVTSVADAGLVVYLGGFQPAVDKAVTSTNATAKALDVASAARLDLTVKDEEDETKTVTDPHFWLDPTRLADVVDAIAQRLETVDPADAAIFRANATATRADLVALDKEFAAGLANCANKNLVTSHEAFGYLSQRYGLTQVGISGLSPEQEPTPRTLAEVSDFVTKNKVTTIYYETLVPADIAKTVAESTGAKTAVLDPIEGLSDSSAAKDYLGIMRADLATLKAGQPCT